MSHVKILNNEDRKSDPFKNQCHLILLFVFYLSSNYVLILNIFLLKLHALRLV